MSKQWYCTSQCSNCQKIFHHMKIVPLDNCTNIVLNLPVLEFETCGCTYGSLIIVLSCGEKEDIVEAGGQLALPVGEVNE